MISEYPWVDLKGAKEMKMKKIDPEYDAFRCREGFLGFGTIREVNGKVKGGRIIFEISQKANYQKGNIFTICRG